MKTCRTCECNALVGWLERPDWLASALKYLADYSDAMVTGLGLESAA